MAESPSVYGNYPITNKTSIAYLSRIDPYTNTRIFDALLGISVTDIESEEIAPTYQPQYKIIGGVQTYSEKMIIAALSKRHSFTLLFTDGLWLRTVLSPYVHPSANCPVDIIIRPTCVDECNDYAFWFSDVVFGAVQLGNLIDIHAEGAPVEASVAATASEPLLISAIVAQKFGENSEYKGALYCNHCIERIPPTTPPVRRTELVIDDFSTDCDAGDLNCPADIGNSSGVTVLNATTVGGERDIWHDMIDCISLFPQKMFCSSNVFVIAQAISQANFNIIYDGVDGDPFVNANGLSLDISTATRFRFNIDFSDDVSNVSPIDVDVYSGAGNMSTASFTTGLIVAPTALDIPLASFSIASGTGADWSNITSIHIHIDQAGLRGLDIVINSITVDAVVEPTPPPELFLVSCCDECHECCRRGYAISDDAIYFTSDGFNSVFELSNVAAPAGMTYVDSLCSESGYLYVSYDDGIGGGSLIAYSKSGATEVLSYSGGPIYFDGSNVWTIDTSNKNVYVSTDGVVFSMYSIGSGAVLGLTPTDLIYDNFGECLYCVGGQAGLPKIYRINETGYYDITSQIIGLNASASSIDSYRICR